MISQNLNFQMSFKTSCSEQKWCDQNIKEFKRKEDKLTKGNFKLNEISKINIY